MAITIECLEHPDYDGIVKPGFDCLACRSLRAWFLDLAPVDVAGLTQDALALGALAVRDGWGGHLKPAPTTPTQPETPAADDTKRAKEKNMNSKDAIDRVTNGRRHGVRGCPERPSCNSCRLDTEALDRIDSDARALWAVRVLDAWQEANPDSHAFATFIVEGGWWRTGSHSHFYKYDRQHPEAARLAAAEAVYPTLPADVRAQLGERP